MQGSDSTKLIAEFAATSFCALFRLIPLCALGLSLALLTLAACNRTEQAAPAKLQEVFYTTPVSEVVTEYEQFSGRTAAVKTVDIRSRVSGYLEKVLFEDGADVKTGQILFKIDDRSFRAEADRATATIEQYRARLARLSSEELRARQLLSTKAISQQEYEAIAADKKETEATINAAIATQDLAKLNLSFTEVRSPIDGRVSRRLVDAGNLVKADDTILVTIVTLDPVYAYFDIDERTVLRLRRLFREGRLQAASQHDLTVQAALADDETFPLTGNVDFVDNQVDPMTGTLRVRAILHNPSRLLSPGLLVRVRFPVGQPRRALLVPEEALATDQGERCVFVVGDQNKVEYRRVKLGILSGGKRVIEEGLKPGDRVIVTGLQRVRAGLEVIPRPVNSTATASSDDVSGGPGGLTKAPASDSSATK